MVKKLINRSEFARRANVSPAAVTKACSNALKDSLTGKRIDVDHPCAVKYLEEKNRVRPDPAVTGLDGLYQQAVDFCQSSNRYSVSGVQRQFKIGYERARKIINTMAVNGLIPEDKPTPVVIKPVLKPHVRGTAAAREKKKTEQPIDIDGFMEIPEDIQSLANLTIREIVEKFGTESRFIDYLSAIQKVENIDEKRIKNAKAKGELISRVLVQNGVIDVFNSAHLRMLKDGAKSIAAGVISKHASGSELSEIEDYITDLIGSFLSPVKDKITRALKGV